MASSSLQRAATKTPTTAHHLQCASCHEPLLLDLTLDSEEGEDDDDDSEGDVEVGKAKSVDSQRQEKKSSNDDVGADGVVKVLDDVEVLSCGCHFHWECFMESYTLTTCPACDRDISSLSPTSPQRQQVLVTVRNEGGVQENFDILPLAQEEAYLRTYPEERRGRAFLGFCAEGDADAIVHLVRDHDDDEDDDGDEEMTDDHEHETGAGYDVLRYVAGEGLTTIDGSGLHAAIGSGREDVAWLLLFLGSKMQLDQFPSEVLEGAKRLGLSEKDRRPEGDDIRALRDSEDLDSEAFAKKTGGVWTQWVERGLLRAP